VELSYKDVLGDDGFSRYPTLGPRSRSAEYVVDSEKSLVTVRFGKNLTGRDIEAYAKRLQLNRSFNPTYDEIVDLTEVEELDLKAEEFLELADEIDPFSPHAKRAFVIRNSVQNHAARMHEMQRAPRNIEIFRSVEEAERWIGT
jgi:hypothetical protein